MGTCLWWVRMECKRSGWNVSKLTCIALLGKPEKEVRLADSSGVAREQVGKSLL